MIRRSKLGLFAPGPKVYDYLLDYPSVVDWIEGYDSKQTRDVYLRTFHVFAVHTGMNPEQLQTVKPEVAKLQLVRLTRNLRDDGKTGWASNIVKSVKSFYRHHGVDLKLRRTERVRVIRKRVDYELIPGKGQVYRMADVAGNPRDRAIILCLWQSGVRVGCIVNWQCGMVLDELFPGDRKTMKLPVKLKISENVDTKLRGSDIGYYYTFLGKEAAEALRDYLEWRLERRENLKQDTPVFVSHSTTVKGRRLRTGAIREAIKRCARDARIDPKRMWPHCLRKAFRKVLNGSDIDEDTKEALMGHKLPGSRGSYFDLHDVDEIAGKYLRCNFSRVEALPEDVKKEMLLTMWRDQARIFGIDPMSIRIERKRDLGRTLTVDEEMNAIQSEIKKMVAIPTHLGEMNGKNNDKPYLSKIVAEEDLVPYVEDGWEIVRDLSSRRFLIRKLN